MIHYFSIKVRLNFYFYLSCLTLTLTECFLLAVVFCFSKLVISQCLSPICFYRYRFSWSPKGVLNNLKSGAKWLENGEVCPLLVTYSKSMYTTLRL